MVPIIESSVAVIHAFADASYDRSSFHLAGAANLVAHVGTALATSALKSLRDVNRTREDLHNSKKDKSTAHPNVGLVDHVSIMPLLLPTSGARSLLVKDATVDEQCQREASGQAARQVGSAMSNLGCVVYYYGSACPDNMPLAQVRKERTNFFRSGGLSPSNGDESQSVDFRYGTSCVGSPENFAENFNIRLSSGGKKAAMSLCRILRERDGGLKGVEALTLPYQHEKFEVACNLLAPDLGSRDAIRLKTNDWARQYNLDEEASIEAMYGVGTTQDECLNVLRLTPESINRHDDLVARRFLAYLS